MIPLPKSQSPPPQQKHTEALILCSLFLLSFTGCPFIFPFAGVSVSPTSHHFPQDQIVWTFDVWNSGAAGSVLEFDVGADQPWISVNPQSGMSEGAGDRVQILVTIDRTSRPFLKGDFNSGTITLTSSVGAREVAVSVAPDYFTELFTTAGPFDLDNTIITFTPDASPNFYTATIEPLIGPPDFPQGPGVSLPLDFTLADRIQITPADDMLIPFYERTHTRFFVSEDGYVDFDPITKAAETLDAHFDAPRISALGANQSPFITGQVFYAQTEDRVIISYIGNLDEDTLQPNSYAIEMFFDGVIRLTYFGVSAQEALVGLSLGGGLPADFVATDLSALAPTPAFP